MTILKSPAFSWVGGKSKLMPQLEKLMPNHTTYVSVFGGAASDILRKHYSAQEIYNDLDQDVVNVFRVFKNAPKLQQLIDNLVFSLYSRVEYGESINVLQSDCKNSLKRAWAFLNISICGVACITPNKAVPGNFAVNFSAVKSKRRTQVTKMLQDIAIRFRPVIVENRPWQQIINKYDKQGTFFYLDPPYVPSARVSKDIYRHEMTDDDHIALATRLQKLKAFAMLSGYDNPIYRKLLKGWRKKTFKTWCSVSPQKKKPERKECVWMNYPQP